MEAKNERSTTTDATSRFDLGIAWRAGGAAGAIAAVAMGVVITVMNLGTLETAIAGLYGFENNLLVGWVAHFLHGMLFGMLFAVVLADPTLVHVHESSWKAIGAGIVYGLTLAIAGAGIIMPIWLTMVGFPSPPSIPFVTPATIGWHLVYGAVLGGVYARIASI